MWGKGVGAIYLTHYHSPVGWLTLGADTLGLCGIYFGKFGSPRESSPHLELAISELEDYFRGIHLQFSVRLHLSGTPFQKKVWQSVSSIPYGALPAYSDIAAEIGRPSATRAVGMAINKNPVPIIIPCHRVIGRDGSLTGYAGGLNIKRELLRLELASTIKNQRALEASSQLF